MTPEQATVTPRTLLPEDLVEFFRAHIHQIVAEISRSIDEVPAGIERLCTALITYWEAGYARRSMRQMLAQAAQGTPLENELDRIGTPFRHLLRLELRSSGLSEPESAVHAIFNEAKDITLEEAISGSRAAERRERLISAIRADALAGLA